MQLPLDTSTRERRKFVLTSDDQVAVRNEIQGEVTVRETDIQIKLDMLIEQQTLTNMYLAEMLGTEFTLDELPL